jgi:hypothetical protein
MKTRLPRIQLWILAAFAESPKGILRVSELCNRTGIGGWSWRRYAIAGGYLSRMAKVGMFVDLGHINGGKYYAFTVEGRQVWLDNRSPKIVTGICRPMSFDGRRLEFTKRAVA